MANLPPDCGVDLDKTLLYQKDQQAFQAARRLRFCLSCKKIGSMDGTGIYRCQCGIEHLSNHTAPRIFQRFMLRAGRQSGKSLIGAHAAREEMTIPNTVGWVCGPTFKILEDATMPTLLRLIPPAWCNGWKDGSLTLKLINDSLVQFRSLDDPERARGPKIDWAWLDEAAFIAERAWDVLRPTLTISRGIAFATTSPAGYDWSYKRFMVPALIEKRPGYWARKYKTIENPRFEVDPAMRAEIEEARATMPHNTFAAEYEGEDVNFTGSIYADLLPGRYILNDEELKTFIPEWPSMDPSRPVIIGLDSGADHPFGAVLIVATHKGLVIIGEYLERHAAISSHLTNITGKFHTSRFANIKWAAGKNEAQLRLEFALQGIGVIAAENKHQVGIQRVQSWLYTKQLWFATHLCPKTVEQFRSYRYADNYSADGQKRDEKVFKINDELPDASRYAMMAWPELPKATENVLTDAQQRRWDALDERTQLDIERVRDFNKQDTEKDLQPNEIGYPVGDFFASYV